MWCFKSPRSADTANRKAGKPVSPTFRARQASSEASSATLPEREVPSSYASSTLTTSTSSGQSCNDSPSFKKAKQQIGRTQSSQRQACAIRARFAAQSCAGSLLDNADKENQDAWFIKDFSLGKNVLMFGIFDGHGENGGVLAQTLSKLLPEMLTQSTSWKGRDYRKALTTQIPACAKAMRSYGLDLSLSGSTAVVAVLESNAKLTVANLGDSRCFIGGVCKDGGCYTIPLSTDHTLEEPAEEQRVRQSKGWVGRCMADGNAVGPKRMYLPNRDIPGLALTRAVGDYVAANIGLSSEPDVIQYQVRSQDRYLVLCSDGIYEFMSNKKIVSLIHMLAQAGCQPEHIAKYLVEEARRRWLKQDGRFVDDCSVLVILLDRPPTNGAPDRKNSLRCKYDSAIMRTASMPSATLLDSCTSHIDAVNHHAKQGRVGRRIHSVSSLVPILMRTTSNDSDGQYSSSPGSTACSGSQLSGLESLRTESCTSSVCFETECSNSGRGGRQNRSSCNFVPALMRTGAHEANVQKLPPSTILSTCDFGSNRKAVM